MGVLAGGGYGIPKPGVRGGWTASFGYGNFPWSVLLIKTRSSAKVLKKSSSLAAPTTISQTHLRGAVASSETSMIAGTSEPDMTRSSEATDLGRTSADDTMNYASREGSQETASEVAETNVFGTKSDDIQSNKAFTTIDPAEKDEEDG